LHDIPGSGVPVGVAAAVAAGAGGSVVGGVLSDGLSPPHIARMRVRAANEDNLTDRERTDTNITTS
jgi:hypothetical protein